MISVLPTTGTIQFQQNIEDSVLYHLKLIRFTSIQCCNKDLLIVLRKKLVGLQSNSFAESVGFEPTERNHPLNGFQDRHHKPLGQLSSFTVSKSTH